MFEMTLAKNMICVVTEDLSGLDPETGKTEFLRRGTPVKIVEIQKPSCASLVSGVCQAPCKGLCLCTVVAEDSEGTEWELEFDMHEPEFPFDILTEEDIENLLQKKGWKQFKMADWTDHGIMSKYAGPFSFSMGVGMILASKGLPDIWGLVGTIVGALVGLYGSTLFIVGNKYSENPITYGEFYFYRDFEKNKAALEALMKLDCKEPKMLINSRAALNFARRLENPDVDDFRSRA